MRISLRAQNKLWSGLSGSSDFTPQSVYLSVCVVNSMSEASFRIMPGLVLL